MGHMLQSIDGVIEEIMNLHISLPPRPNIDEVEAAIAVVRNIEREEQSRIESISKQKKAFEIPEELFFVLQEMQKNLVYFQSKEQKREALKLLDLENIHSLFDEMIERASRCVPSSSNGMVRSIPMSSVSVSNASAKIGFGSSANVYYSEKEIGKSSERVSRDDSYVKKAKSTMYADGGGADMSMSRGLFANSTISPATTSDYNRLKCLPEALGKLESLEILTVRYNNIKGLPTTMSSLLKLKELDVSFNELESLPESLCFATALVKLNIGNNFANLLSLPRSIGNLEMLEELDMSNNQIRVLPDSFAMLSNLCILRAEENPLEVPPRHIAELGAQAVVQYMVDLVAKRDVKTSSVKNKKGWCQNCFFSRPNKRKSEGWDYVT